MIAYLFLFLSVFSWALPMPGSWSSAFKIIEVHEFYPERKAITEPKDSWQHLFSILILNENFEEQKDCVFYFVPGEQPGRVKIKTISPADQCSDSLMNPGDNDWENISDLEFSRSEKGLKLSFTQSKKELINWEILTSGFTSPEPAPHMSSAELKSPRYVLLAKASSPSKEKNLYLSNDQLCHGINDSCEEVSASICHLCESGWYEIPNGCAKGPKFCGRLDCGGKNRPACRRGRDYQRKEKDFDCRLDNSFAYCQKGLSIQCEGQKAYCR